MGRRGSSKTVRGMTVVEIVIVAVLFAVLIGSASQLYFSSVQSERKLGVKIDLLHHAQIASLRLSKELRHAAEIFYPPPPAPGGPPPDKTRPFVVFSDELNQLKTIYVNEKRQLVLQNRNDSDKVEVLASGVDRLRVFRKGRRLLNYHLFLQDAPTGEKFNLISGLCIRNNFN